MEGDEPCTGANNAAERSPSTTTDAAEHDPVAGEGAGEVRVPSAGATTVEERAPFPKAGAVVMHVPCIGADIAEPAPAAGVSAAARSGPTTGADATAERIPSSFRAATGAARAHAAGANPWVEQTTTAGVSAVEEHTLRTPFTSGGAAGGGGSAGTREGASSECPICWKRLLISETTSEDPAAVDSPEGAATEEATPGVLH